MFKVNAYDVYNIDDFDYTLISSAAVLKRKKGNPGTRKTKQKYKNLFCAFDIETTNLLDLENAIMYIWQFQIEDKTVVGRSWEEFNIFLGRLKDELKSNEYLVIYVHNLSFEFHFLQGIYDFDNDEIFAIDRRKVLKCEMFGCFEFRCSYLLTNMSLDLFTEKMGVTHKLSGDKFNYSVVRYPWTVLTNDEMEYCIVDVISLVEALKVYFAIEYDTFYTIPLTSTGFVRRDVKSAMRHYNKDLLKAQLPDLELFRLLRDAFRGGNTHANRYYSGQIIDNVCSYDRVSSYPDVQINELFPMGEWIREDKPSMERVLRKVYKQHRACIMRIVIFGLRLKDKMFGCPYIPKHKCSKLSSNHYNDNGRILYADFIEISVTDIDLKIILDEYDFDEIACSVMFHTRYAKLPKPMRDEIIKFYKLKTELKNVEGQELVYMLAKQKLNSIYGMCVQSPVKQDIIYDDKTFTVANVPELELLMKSNKKAFLNYAWGVWTTAHARYQLEIAIKRTGNNFIYCDTDSVKYIADDNINFDDYNRKRKLQSIKNGGVAIDPAGVNHYLGLYEYEGLNEKFVTLGAKKYCYQQNGKLKLTVAGVGKSKGAEEIKRIENFKEGFIFKKAGGTESIYNDDIEKTINIEGHDLTITSNVFIRDSTYTLGTTGEYKKIIAHPAIWLDLVQ